jgi:transglutaminase-like putative cysteine protease
MIPMKRLRLLWALRLTIILLMVLEVGEAAHLVSLPFTLTEVVNTSSESDLYWPLPDSDLRDGFSIQRQGVEYRLISWDYGVLPQIRGTVYAEVPAISDSDASDLERVVALRKWVRSSFLFANYDSPHKMLSYAELVARRESADNEGLCDAYAVFFIASASSVGIPARLVHLLTQPGPGHEGHYVVEAWVDDLNKWVLQDPLYNTMYEVNNIPASALEIQRSFYSPGCSPPRLRRDGATTQPDPTSVNGLRKWYKHFQIVNRTDFDEYGLFWPGQRVLFVNWVDHNSSSVGKTEATLRILVLGQPVLITLLFLAGWKLSGSVVFLIPSKEDLKIIAAT